MPAARWVMKGLGLFELRERTDMQPRRGFGAASSGVG